MSRLMSRLQLRLSRVVMIALVFAIGGAAIDEAHAKAMISVGANLNYEVDSSGRTYEAKLAPIAVRAGWRFNSVDLFGEYSYSKQDASGTEMVQVGNENHEALFWARMAYPGATIFKPFLAVALGLHRQTVFSTVGTEQRSDVGELEGMAAAAAGLEIVIAKQFNATFEGRLSSAPSYAPNPIFGGAAYLGFLF